MHFNNCLTTNKINSKSQFQPTQATTEQSRTHLKSTPQTCKSNLIFLYCDFTNIFQTQQSCLSSFSLITPKKYTKSKPFHIKHERQFKEQQKIDPLYLKYSQQEINDSLKIMKSYLLLEGQEQIQEQHSIESIKDCSNSQTFYTNSQFFYSQNKTKLYTIEQEISQISFSMNLQRTSQKQNNQITSSHKKKYQYFDTDYSTINRSLNKQSTFFKNQPSVKVCPQESILTSEFNSLRLIKQQKQTILQQTIQGQISRYIKRQRINSVVNQIYTQSQEAQILNQNYQINNKNNPQDDVKKVQKKKTNKIKLYTKSKLNVNLQN